jgi:hypothetical protein
MVFIRHIGIDYSGAQTPTASLKGLRVYLAEGYAPPGDEHRASLDVVAAHVLALRRPLGKPP